MDRGKATRYSIAGISLLVLLSVVVLASGIGLSTAPSVQATNPSSDPPTTNSFSPGVRTDFSYRPDSTLARKGPLENYIENSAENIRIENYANYVEVLRDNDFSTDNYSRLIDNIPIDWTENSSDNFVSFRRPTSSKWVWDMNVLSENVLGRFRKSDPASVYKIQFTVKPNRITYLLNQDNYQDFRDEYYYNGTLISQTEFDNLKTEITEIPVHASAGSFENAVTRPITPPTQGSRDWIDRGESNKITLTVNLNKKNAGYALASGKLGSHSLSWSVTSETDWWDNTLDNDVRTTISGGSLGLSGENAALWMPFDDFPGGYGSTDNTVYDLTSYVNDGTAKDDNLNDAESPQGPTIENSVWDNALDFDGVDDYVEVPDDPSIKFGSGDFTVMGWFKTSADYSSNAGTILKKDDDTGSVISYSLDVDVNNQARLHFRDPDGDLVICSSTAQVNDGNWHHIVGKRVGDTGYIYLDGSQVNSDTNTAIGDVDNTNPARIGSANKFGGKFWFDGIIDEVMIFDKALSENEIKRIYNRTAPDNFDPPNDTIQEGTWTSKIWDSGNKNIIENIEYGAAISSGENVWWNVEATDTGENTGWFKDSNQDNLITRTELPSNPSGESFQLSIKLETDNTTHSPSVQGYTLNVYSPPIIESVSIDNTLIDRDDDGRSSTTATEIEVQVRDYDGGKSIDNVILKVRDNSNSVVFSKEMTDNTIISENVENYAYIYDPTDGLMGWRLGGFDVYIEASDDGGKSDNYGWSQDFRVDDLIFTSNSFTPMNSRMGLAHGFDVKVEGIMQYAAVELEDSCESGWTYSELGGNNVFTHGALDSGVWSTEGSGSMEIGADNDLVPENLWAQFEKTIDLSNVENMSFDIRSDGGSSNENVEIQILVEGEKRFSKPTDTSWEMTKMLYLGSFTGDNSITIRLKNTSENTDAKMGNVYVDYLRSSVTHAKGHIWISTPESSDEDLGDTYYHTWQVSTAPGKVVNVNIKANDNYLGSSKIFLDGSATRSFTVNDNRFYRIRSYYEETWNLVPDNDFENKPWEVSFRSEDYGTENYPLDNQNENFVIHHDVRSVVFRDTSTENFYKRTYLVREPKENVEIVIFQDISHVRPYTLHLNDLTGFYSPPDSAIKVYKVKNNIRRNVIHRFWPATGSFDASLIYTEAYKIELIPESGTGSYYFGLFEAGQLYEQTIDVTWDAVENAFPTRTNVEYPISYSIARDNGEIKVSYLDVSENTNYVTIQIWDKMQENLIFSENVYDDNFNWVYNNISENKAYWVRLSVDHDVYDQLKHSVWSSLGTEIGAVLPSPTSVPSLDLPIPLASIAGFFTVGIVGMLFYRGRGQAGIAMLSIAFTVVGLKIGSEAMGVNLMPINAVAVGALVVLAVLYKLGEGSGR